MNIFRFNISRFILLSFCVFLAACSSNRLAMNETPTMQATGPLAHAMTVGDVDGAKSWLFRPTPSISNGDFKDGLEKAIATRGLLAGEGQTPKYEIDATINFSDSGGYAWDTVSVKSDVRYVIVRLQDRAILMDQTIHADGTIPAMNDGSVWKTILFTAPNQAAENAKTGYTYAAINNLSQFLAKLDAWRASQSQ